MLVASLVLSLAQPAGMAAAPRSPTPSYSSHRGRRLFISPMGEPFRVEGRNDDPLADWFHQADRNHDDRLTLDEMEQDAERFFAQLDSTMTAKSIPTRSSDMRP